jgi:hypothetical protein
MKRKKNFPDRFSRDKYQDGPRKPGKMKPQRFTRDDDDDGDPLETWRDSRRRYDEPDAYRGLDEEE